MVRKDTNLPFGDAFSPAQLDTDDSRGPLPVVLELAKDYEGDPNRFDHAVKQEFFPDDDGTTRSKNIRLGLSPSGYQITDENFHLTDLGEELYNLRDDPDTLYDCFAQHILRDLHGLKGIEIIEDLRAEGKQATNANLKGEFRNQYGFHIDETSNHWSQMRGWLSEAGVVNTGSHRYDIDRRRIEELVGAGSETILKLDGLTEQQQAFLRALALIDPDEPIKNAVVRKIAEEAYGVDISQSNISRRTLDPLEEEGYIEWKHVSGKPNLIEPTDKFDTEVVKPILDDVAERTGAPRNVLRKSYSELLDKLNKGNKHERGVALEALAVKIGRTLGLEFVGWRVRAQKTGGSEIDVVFDDVGTLFNRVQIQAKNVKGKIGAKTVAREVGIVRLLKTNTVLMIARGGVSADAKQFARRIMQEENITIVFLTDDTIEKLDEQTDELLTALRDESRRAHLLKSVDGDIDQDEDGQTESREQEALEKYEDEWQEAVENEEDTSLDDFADES